MSQTLLFRTLGAVLLAGAVSAAQEGTAGPLVGQVSSARAELWMYVPAKSGATVSYRRDQAQGEAEEAAFVAVPDPAVAAPGRPLRVTLSGLSPETDYVYQVSVAGKSRPEWAGSFTTAPEAGTRGKLRVALTSCMKVGQPQSSWYLLLAQQPDLHLLLGDSHYANTTDPIVQWQHHARYRKVPEFATVLRNLPTYSMWDDHDFGPNDSDGTTPGKEGSLLGWKQFWANPSAGTPEIPGAFYKFSWGDVDFFVVDGRYHRTPDKAPDDDKKRMLGDAQYAWLLAGLKASSATFKVIASGSTLHHGKGDSWRVYEFSRHRLFDDIKQHELCGVMYFSGDLHSSLVWEHPESERVGYPFVEVLSSGIAASNTRSFATIDFDTAREDPSVRVRIVHGDGTVRADRTWKLSQLGGK